MQYGVDNRAAPRWLDLDLSSLTDITCSVQVVSGLTKNTEPKQRKHNGMLAPAQGMGSQVQYLKDDML